MNDQKIYECIAMNGPMTAAALAAAMETEVNDTIEHLAALRSVGDLVLVDGVYSFGRGFMSSEDYRRAKNKVLTILQARAAGGETMLDRALNFLIARGGECTGSDLHAALGLLPDELPSAVLAEALVQQRLFKDGKLWRLDRRAVPRTSASLSIEFEEELNSGSALRVEQVSTVRAGDRGARETRVVQVNESMADALLGLNWKAAPDCNTEDEVDC